MSQEDNHFDFLDLEDGIRSQLATEGTFEKKRRYERFVLAALSSVPWVGGLLSGAASASAESDQSEVNALLQRWLEEHSRKMQLLSQTLEEMVQRIELFGAEGQSRIECDEFIDLVRQGFSTWDKSATDEKRRLVQALLTNAVGTTLCSDDVVRLFLDWIEKYHEIHFSVIREIFKSTGISRQRIWSNIYGAPARDDSAEADLFRLLISDLSVGRVIRQHRAVNSEGQFLKKPHGRRTSSSSPVMKSAFDSEDAYELTQLGRQFVHYTMNEVVPRLGG